MTNVLRLPWCVETTDRVRIIDADGHAAAVWDKPSAAALVLVDLMNMCHEDSPNDPDDSMASLRSTYKTTLAHLDSIDWPPRLKPRESE